MVTEQLLTQVRPGMAVHTADGYHLGTVAQVWARTDSTAQDPHADPDGDSRVEVYHGVVVHRVVYVPARAIAAVAAGHVTLTMDAATVDEQAWGTEPAWIATAQTGRDPEPPDDLGRTTTMS